LFDVLFEKDSEFDFMRVLTFSKREFRSQIFLEVFLFLDSFEDSFIESLLVCDFGSIDLFLLFILSKELFRLSFLLLVFWFFEVSVVELLINFEVSEVDNG